MPIYEYQCATCGHQLEIIQKMSDKPLTECPECRQPALNKLVSAAGLQFKGTGWYKTDYSTKGKPKPGTETGPASDSSSSGGGAEAKSADTKTKGDTKSKESAKNSSSTSGTSSSSSGAAS
jgi:putative FmdB family regulatory protein